MILSNNLTDEVKAEVKDTLKKPKSQAPPLVYKVLKKKILDLFGPKEGQRFEEAAQLVLTSKPSALAKRITELLCECNKDNPLEGCCQVETVSALWRRQLPQQVRSQIAGMSLKTNYEGTLKLADDVFAAQGAPGVSAVAVGDEEVAAFGRGGGRRGAGQRGGRSRGRGQGRGQGRAGQHDQGQQQQQQFRSRHPEAVDGSCSRHLRYGPKAYFCTHPNSCPMAQQIAPRPNDN